VMTVKPMMVSSISVLTGVKWVVTNSLSC
jgi:hypothetical protein